MKKTILFLGILIFSFTMEGVAQNDGEDKKLSKKERKEARKREREEKIGQLTELAEERSYALQAENILDSKNTRFNTDPSLNFIAVNGDKMKIQMALSTVSGWSGDTEDIVTEGEIRKYEVKAPKNIKVEILASSTQLGTVDVVILIDPSGTGRAYIDNQYGDRITLVGQILPLSESFIFEQSGGY